MKQTLIFQFLIVFFLFGCETAEKEIVVVPKGYEGYALIIFNQASGLPPKYEGEKRVYQIPANGILKTQFSANYGWGAITEFYHGGIEEKCRLPSYIELNKIPENTVVGFMGSNGNVNKDLAGKERVAFFFFYVGTKVQVKRAQEEAKKIDFSELINTNR